MHSTWKGRSSGHGIEGNALMNVGTGGQIAIKAAASAAIVFGASRLHRHHPKLAKGLLWGAAALTTGVAVNNYSIARR